MVNTHSPTVRWREQTRLSRACCGAWWLAIPAPGGPTPWCLLPLVCLPFWPLLFEFQEDEVAVHSMQANLRHYRRVWKQVWVLLLCSSLLSQRHADRCRAPALSYCACQKVGLSTRDLLLQVEARKLAPWFVGPFRSWRMVNALALCLRLSASVKVHPTFHVSLGQTRRGVGAGPASPPPGVLTDVRHFR